MPKCYLVGKLTLLDRSWIADYVAVVTKMVERRGGRFLARTNNAQWLEQSGEVPHVVVLIEWASKEAALAFYHSDEYRPYLQQRLQGARNEFVLVPAEDVTAQAQMEPSA
ncbi:MAG TPA: DUF1330 domain-containing protein [Burkholderiaceae bacterium]|jgi:uncharacterized protein (DUF1330 family)|nr:DUF1330 domain-containing protein [Burkholderiaceae bacterium]